MKRYISIVLVLIICLTYIPYNPTTVRAAITRVSNPFSDDGWKSVRDAEAYAVLKTAGVPQTVSRTLERIVSTVENVEKDGDVYFNNSTSSNNVGVLGSGFSYDGLPGSVCSLSFCVYFGTDCSLGTEMMAKHDVLVSFPRDNSIDKSNGLMTYSNWINTNYRIMENNRTESLNSADRAYLDLALLYELIKNHSNSNILYVANKPEERQGLILGTIQCSMLKSLLTRKSTNVSGIDMSSKDSTFWRDHLYNQDGSLKDGYGEVVKSVVQVFGSDSATDYNDDYKKVLATNHDLNSTEDDRNEHNSQVAGAINTPATEADYVTWCQVIMYIKNGQEAKVPDADSYKVQDNLKNSTAAGLTDKQKYLAQVLACAYSKRGFEDWDMPPGSSIATINASSPTDNEIIEYNEIIDVVTDSYTYSDDLFDYGVTYYARFLYYYLMTEGTYTIKVQTDASKSNSVKESVKTFKDNYDDKFSIGVDTCALTFSDLHIDKSKQYRNLVEVCQEINSFVEKFTYKQISDLSTHSVKLSYYNALDSIYKVVTFAKDKCGEDALIDVWKTRKGQQSQRTLEECYEELSNDESVVNDIEDLDATQIDPESGLALQQFFNLDEETLSDELLHGIAYSAAYVPMRTNVYDPYVTANMNTDFLYEFHYKYGYFRKALYKVDSSQAAQELMTTGNTGNKSVCTLRDVVDPAGEIVLYIDDNFYNANKLAELLDKSYDYLTQTGNGEYIKNEEAGTDTMLGRWWHHVTDDFMDLMDLDFATQVKTNGKTTYSQRMFNKVQNIKNGKYIPLAKWEDITTSINMEDDRSDDNDDGIVLTSGQINYFLDMIDYKATGESDGGAYQVYQDYDVLQGYSIVSAIYRDSTLFQKATSQYMKEPVFIASEMVPTLPSANICWKNVIFNWCTLKNLESQMPIGYNTNLDMDAPLYMDIYGNILTESGTVVVPAASNATLFNEDFYDGNGFTMALAATYGKNYHITDDNVGDALDGILSEMFEKDDGTWHVKGRTYKDRNINVAKLSTADKETQQAVQSLFYTYLKTGSLYLNNAQAESHGYNIDQYVHIVLEVMRGAPIENIDKEFEGLNTARVMTNAGLEAAAKLESLDDTLSDKGENTLLAIPNLAFVDGFEYICLFTFKILLLAILVVLMVTLYRDTVGGTITLHTWWKCISLLVTTCLAVITIPTVFDISYYQANKLFLQDETEYIGMLNEEKRQNGVEIGVLEISEPDISTELLIKLDDVEVPWYDLFQDIMLSSTFKGLDAVYEEYFHSSPISRQQDVMIKNDGIYISLDTLLDSLDVTYDTTTKDLRMSTDVVTTAAFYMPYYPILEMLVFNVNEFNREYNWYAGSTTLQKGGRLKSIGMISAYFQSEDFMEEGADILCAHQIFGEEPELERPVPFTEEDYTLMSKTYWYNGYGRSISHKQALYLLSERAQKFVVKNRNLLGKVCDETFLKMMALDIAMYSNRLYSVPVCNAIEILDLSQDDLMRLMIGTTEEATYNSTLSFGRYAYQVGGVMCVYLAAILEIVLFLIGYIKPLLTLAIFVLVFVSLFIFKVCLRKKTSTIYGYIITTILLCLCNVVYAVALKLSLHLPNMGLNPCLCILVDILVQLVYVAALCGVLINALKDWRELGYARYQVKATQAEVGAAELAAKFKFWRHTNNTNREEMRNIDKIHKSKDETGWQSYERMSARREKRKRKYGIG